MTNGQFQDYGTSSKERGVRGYLRRRKAELIMMLQSTKPQPPPQLQIWEPMRPRSPHPKRSSRPPPTQKPGGPPKLKNLKQLEKKKRNLEN